RGGVRRDAARAFTDALGVSGSARPADQREAQGPIPGDPRLLRLPGVPEPRGPADPLPPARARDDRPAPHGGLHDGPGGLRVRARLPPSRREILQGRIRLGGREAVFDHASRPTKTQRARTDDPGPGPPWMRGESEWTRT